MYLHDLIDPADLDRGIKDGLIKVRHDSAEQQRIYNYSDAAMYTSGAWDNPAVRQCRGLITDLDGRIIARPWAKFFNHGQKEAGNLDLFAPVQVTDKMDGSLGILHRGGSGRLRVATRGSFESDQAKHATAWLDDLGYDAQDFGYLDTVTPLVEIIYPANRIVCDYGVRDELVLLGGVNIDTGEYLGPNDAAFARWPFARTRVFEYDSLHSALAAKPRAGAEGLCVRFLDRSHVVKIKQEDYVLLHRIVTGLSERSVWQHMSDGGALPGLLGPMPDELHDWTREVWDRLTTATDAIESDARLRHRRILADLPPGHARGDFAARAKACGLLAPYLFQIYDGRDPRPSILRTLKPAGDTRARPTSEATA